MYVILRIASSYPAYIFFYSRTTYGQYTEVGQRAQQKRKEVMPDVRRVTRSGFSGISIFSTVVTRGSFGRPE